MNKNCLCDLQENEEKLITEGSYVNLYIKRKHGEYLIEAISDGYAGMIIDFCPECGRELVEDEPEENDFFDI